MNFEGGAWLRVMERKFLTLLFEWSVYIASPVVQPTAFFYKFLIFIVFSLVAVFPSLSHPSL